MDAGLDKNALYAEHWAQRASAELGAAKKFKTIHSRLQDQATHSSILKLVNEAVTDEENHAYLCAKMAKSLGHKTGFTGSSGSAASAKPSWHNLSEPKKLLLDLVLMSCVVESINANLMTTLFSNSKESSVNGIIRKILKDEIKHGKIGWAYLSYLQGQQELSFIAEHLAEMLDIAVRDELFDSNEAELQTNAYEFGVLPEEQRLGQFCDSLQNIVQPGLSHFGIDNSAVTNWLKEKTQMQLA